MAKKGGLESAIDLAHHAKALYDIIKAALASGWTGAAFAAVKHYWPQVLSIAFFILLIPPIIFFSLPSFLMEAFGLGELTAEQLINMYYSGYTTNLGEHQQRIEDEFYNSLGAIEDYDENTSAMISGSIERSGEVLNRDWFIAIHTVYNGNTEPTIDNIYDFSEFLIEHSVDEEITDIDVHEYEADPQTGIVPPTEYILYIERLLSIIYVNPYRLMELLEFDSHDISWAEAIYNNMRDEALLEAIGEINVVDADGGNAD